MGKKYLDDNGVLYLWSKIKSIFVAKEEGKGLSSNDYTTEEKNKLAGIATGANKTVVDSSLSSTSTNPVQNKVITAKFDNYLPLTGGTLTGELTGTTFVGSLTGNASSASKLETSRNINGLSFNGTADRVNYASCSTAASTAAKTVDCAGFMLVTGAEITVKFTVNNTASSPTLNVNGTGAKAIYYRGAAITAGYLAANRTYTFRYNGTQYELVGDINVDTNTDTKVTQSANSTENYRPLLMGYTSSTDNTALGASATNVTYVNTSIYAKPSSGSIYATEFVGDLTGNADTATKLSTGRTLTIGNKGKAFDGSTNVSWSLSDIGAAASSHTHSYLPLSGGTLTGDLTGTTFIGNLTGNADTATTANSATTATSADKATKLSTARNINGLLFDGTANRVNYGSCSTAAATAAKVVACTGFALVTGAEITVKFTVTNTAASPTLNVNSTGAKEIYYRGAAITAGYLAANRTYTFRYNGTQYDLVGDIDTNTTYSAATTSAAGLMSAADKTKLDGIATGANKTTVDSALSSTSTNPVQNKVINTALASKISTSTKGQPNGVATLGSDGLIPSSQLPSYVDDVVEGYYYNSKFYKESEHTTEITGETGKIYVDLSTNNSYRYGGSTFVLITSSDMVAITNSEIDSICV